MCQEAQSECLLLLLLLLAGPACCCCCCCCCCAASAVAEAGPRRRARRCGLFRDPHKEEAPSVRLDLPPARVDRPGRVDWVALTSGPLSLRTVRLPHTRHGSRSPVITVAAAQRARGARDGGAEQRPLARCRCSVCQPETRALPLHARLLPCPVTRRALARPPHRARSARLLAAAARPAPPRLPPLLTRTPRRRRSGTDGAATAPAVAALGCIHVSSRTPSRFLSVFLHSTLSFPL